MYGLTSYAYSDHPWIQKQGNQNLKTLLSCEHSISPIPV